MGGNYRYRKSRYPYGLVHLGRLAPGSYLLRVRFTDFDQPDGAGDCGGPELDAEGRPVGRVRVGPSGAGAVAVKSRVVVVRASPPGVEEQPAPGSAPGGWRGNEAALKRWVAGADQVLVMERRHRRDGGPAELIYYPLAAVKGGHDGPRDNFVFNAAEELLMRRDKAEGAWLLALPLTPERPPLVASPELAGLMRKWSAEGFDWAPENLGLAVGLRVRDPVLPGGVAPGLEVAVRNDGKPIVEVASLSFRGHEHYAFAAIEVIDPGRRSHRLTRKLTQFRSAGWPTHGRLAPGEFRVEAVRLDGWQTVDGEGAAQLFTAPGTYQIRAHVDYAWVARMLTEREAYADH